MLQMEVVAAQWMNGRGPIRSAGHDPSSRGSGGMVPSQLYPVYDRLVRTGPSMEKSHDQLRRWYRLKNTRYEMLLSKSECPVSICLPRDLATLCRCARYAVCQTKAGLVFKSIMQKPNIVDTKTKKEYEMFDIVSRFIMLYLSRFQDKIEHEEGCRLEASLIALPLYDLNPLHVG